MEKEVVEFLATRLVEAGYAGLSPEAVVEQVMIGMREHRLNRLSKYVGRRVQVEVGGMYVDVTVRDVKLTDEGVQYQVEPVSGAKHVWVKKFASVN